MEDVRLSDMEPGFSTLMNRSKKLDKVVEGFLLEPLYDESERYIVSRVMCSISFEHAESIKALIDANNLISATSLLRLQFETVVRSAWLLYAANNEAISALQSDLSEGEQVAKAERLPMLTTMLQQLEGKAPAPALQSLKEFKDASWKPLNSFLHAGIHAANRYRKGYPLELLLQVLKNSNGLSIIICKLMSALAGDQRTMSRANALNVEFRDCLPDAKRSSE